MSSREQNLPLAIFLMGPTASGKTDLAMQLVRQLPAEIISVDSALVYRGLDIGSAKPDANELAQAPHRLINICEPNESYSAARFREDALREMDEIVRVGRIPLLVGGTMLYFKALEKGLSRLPESDPAIRSALQAEAVSKGWQALHQELADIDPVAADRIHQNDPQRILRALEVYRISGQTLTTLQQATQGEKLPYRVVKLIRAPKDRSILHDRIKRRYEMMIEHGFEDEVRKLWSRGDLDPDLPSMRSVGYRQMLKFITGEWDHETMVEKGIVATRQLAKRQFTWLRAESNAHWLDEDQDVLSQALKIIESAHM